MLLLKKLPSTNQLTERTIECNKLSSLAVVDSEKVFDSVEYTVVFNSLRKQFADKYFANASESVLQK